MAWPASAAVAMVAKLGSAGWSVVAETEEAARAVTRVAARDHVAASVVVAPSAVGAVATWPTVSG